MVLSAPQSLKRQILILLFQDQEQLLGLQRQLQQVEQQQQQQRLQDRAANAPQRPARRPRTPRAVSIACAQPTTYFPPKEPSRLGWEVKPQLVLREAAPADIRRITQIAQSAISANPHFRLCFPRAAKFPQDACAYISSHVEASMLSPVHRVVVCVAATMCTVPNSVVGFAVWERVGPGAGQAADEKDSSRAWLGRHIRCARTLLCKPIDFNCAVDYTALPRLQKARQEYEQTVWAAHAARWHLRSVTTHAGWRGFGAGTRLICWGMQRAEDEGIVAAAETTPEGEHCEEIFVRLRWSRRSAFLPTVQGVDMGTAMVYRPPTLKQRALGAQMATRAMGDAARGVGMRKDAGRDREPHNAAYDPRSAAERTASRVQKEFEKHHTISVYRGRTPKHFALKGGGREEAVGSGGDGGGGGGGGGGCEGKSPPSMPGGWIE